MTENVSRNVFVQKPHRLEPSVIGSRMKGGAEIMEHVHVHVPWPLKDEGQEASVNYCSWLYSPSVAATYLLEILAYNC